jgi:hypothetical protein
MWAQDSSNLNPNYQLPWVMLDPCLLELLQVAGHLIHFAFDFFFNPNRLIRSSLEFLTFLLD